MTSLRYLYSLSVCALILFSCQKNDKAIAEKLTMLEQVVDQNPDSVFSILDSINNPYSLSEKNYNKFFLLQIQAKDKAYKNITDDTVIFRVKDYYVKKSDMKNAALSSFYCGRVLQEKNKNEQAIDEYQTAERYAKDTKNNTLKGLIESSIGSIFLKEFMETEAIEHFAKSAWYFNIANNTRNEIITYNQMGNAYLMKSINDSAFYYYKKGLKLAEISQDSLQMANITQCIGIAYRQTGYVNLAIKYFRDATKYTTNDDYRSKLYLNISKTFYERGTLDSARFYVNKSLSIAQSEDINLLANIYKTLSLIAEKQSNLDMSLSYYKKHTGYLEQIVDENKNVEILELQKKYKYELLQNENNRLKIKEQKTFLVFILIVASIGIITVFFYKRYVDNKRNVLERDNKILAAEKKIYQLIEMSNTCNEREASIKSVLLHHFNILKKAALLKSLKNLDEQNSRLIKKVNEIVYGQESLNWGTLYQHMNKIYGGLFERLKIKYPQLDETQFRVCFLTYAGFTCSEIGVILDLSPNTVQMKRSSIRKKMGIEAQGNIQVHIDDVI